MRGPPSYPYYDEQDDWPRTQIIFQGVKFAIDYTIRVEEMDRWLVEQAGNAFQSKWSLNGATYWIKSPQIAFALKMRFGAEDVLFVELVD